MSRSIAITATLVVLAVGSPLAADDEFHGEPFDFLFGNHIDTHQETNLAIDEDSGRPESLFGKFYIIFTGETDPVSGLRIARHPRGMSGNHDERCGITVKCKIGWEMQGLPGAARFLYHAGVNGDDHPVWMVNRAEEASAPATGMVLPQPGSHTHFHWITTTSTDPRAATVPAECDKMNAGQLQHQLPSAVDFVCQGWFLQIKAKRKFAFEHGGEIIPIHPGMDNRSHLNLVTNFNNQVQITRTRHGGGGH